MQKYTPDEIARFVAGRLLDNTGTPGSCSPSLKREISTFFLLSPISEASKV
ncbi:hypothetical protein LW377_004504 [Salmonella enterica]|nr:hypothetical protein [Salmonella enterica]